MSVTAGHNTRHFSYSQKNSNPSPRYRLSGLEKTITSLLDKKILPENHSDELSDLPQDLRQRVLEQLHKDSKYFGIKPGSRTWTQRQQDYINSLLAYFDGRFEINTGRKTYRFKNREWTKYYLKNTLRSALINRRNPQKLTRIIRCAIDINGLKSINDLSDKAKGDEFLDYTASQLYNLVKNNIIRRYGKSLKFSLVSEGGDEFAIYIELPRPAQKKDITYIYKTISRGLCFDCSSYISNDAIIKNGEISIPRSISYIFRSSAGVGVDSLYSLIFNKKTYGEIKQEQNIEDALISAILNRADELTEKDKEKYKYRLSRSKNPQDIITYQILMRNKDMVRLYQENKKLHKILTSLKKQKVALNTTLR